MNSVSEDHASEGNLSGSHDDKYNDPRARLTGRGIAIGIAVVALGVVGAGLSIWARKTQLVETTRFWGPEVITAFQLAEEVELLSPGDDSAAASEPVRLSGMPGLGHLRHVFLDDRSYDWDSVLEEPISTRDGSKEFIAIQFRDPTAGRFSDMKIVVDLETGWVGNPSEDRQVRFNERFRNAVPNYLKQIADYEPMRVEMRKKKAAGG